tara:strand:+ start:785 stop:1765 length:981 start_codon:yes stop_codon:yes gene_type:complete
MEPVPLKLNFIIPASSNDVNFIDISQCVSALSRKFFRQGLNWAVAGGRIIMPTASTPDGNGVYLSTLPHTWTMSNSWEKVFRAWRRQQKEALEDGDQESIRAAFNDFKIHADANHLQNGFGTNLLPVNLGPQSVVGPFPSAVTYSAPVMAGEWEASQIVIPNYGSPGTNYEPYLMAVGANVGGVGGALSLVDLYQNSRALPQSPDPVTPGGLLTTDNYLSAMFDVGDNNLEVLDNVSSKNDELPYNHGNYPGGDTNFPVLENQVAVLNTNTVGFSEYKFTGFSAPCGLIRVDQMYSDDSSTFPLVIELELMPGTHRGYLAEPMTEM